VNRGPLGEIAAAFREAVAPTCATFQEAGRKLAAISHDFHVVGEQVAVPLQEVAVETIAPFRELRRARWPTQHRRAMPAPRGHCRPQTRARGRRPARRAATRPRTCGSRAGPGEPEALARRRRREAVAS
jgi:hypothetical protein